LCVNKKAPIERQKRLTNPASSVALSVNVEMRTVVSGALEYSTAVAIAPTPTMTARMPNSRIMMLSSFQWVAGETIDVTHRLRSLRPSSLPNVRASAAAVQDATGRRRLQAPVRPAVVINFA
jgi:hypothetical protein